MIAMTMVTLGTISIESMALLANAFPQLELVLTTSNRYLFDVGRKSIERTLEKAEKKVSLKSCEQLLEETY